MEITLLIMENHGKIMENCVFLIFVGTLYMKHVTPQGEGGHFWSQGHNLNILGKSPIRGAIYQISRL